VVVPVRAQDRPDDAAPHRLDDRRGVVGGVDDAHLAVVADDPDVVVDVEVLAVDGEDAVCHDAFRRHRTTTDRSTSPRSILWNASSTSPRVMRSLTNRSRSSRPCRYRSTSSGKSRLGRQSPYQLGFSAPPRPKNSIIGSSMRMLGSGTPTCTSVPARSRA